MDIEALPDPQPADYEGPLHPKALDGLELFNRGEYWLAHEALEEAWRAEPGEIRHLYRGILQVGVTYFHLLRCNYDGVIKLHQRSHRWLDPFHGYCRGIDVDTLKQDYETVFAEVQRLGSSRIAEFNRDLLKPVRYQPDE